MIFEGYWTIKYGQEVEGAILLYYGFIQMGSNQRNLASIGTHYLDHTGIVVVAKEFLQESYST